MKSKNDIEKAANSLKIDAQRLMDNVTKLEKRVTALELIRWHD